MDAIYVMEPGSYLKKDGESLKIFRGREVLATIPAVGLERLTLVGRASMSGAVLDFLVNNKVDTVFITSTGRFRARILLDEAGHVELRRGQYRSLSDPEATLRAARIIVTGKIENAARFLLLRARQHGSAPIRQAAVRLRMFQKRLPLEKNLDTLRGVEGAAARVYFEAFPQLLRTEEFVFSGRTRRPPRDPVNALLSFAYTMFTNEVLSAVQTAGLDPYLGSLHAPEHGRPSLACDLVEEWRTLADRLVLTLINKRLVGKNDFVIRTANDQGLRPVEMKPATMRAFIQSYERLMASRLDDPYSGEKTVVRWLIHSQARRFGRFLANPEELYRPMKILTQ